MSFKCFQPNRYTFMSYKKSFKKTMKMKLYFVHVRISQLVVCPGNVFFKPGTKKIELYSYSSCFSLQTNPCYDRKGDPNIR